MLLLLRRPAVHQDVRWHVGNTVSVKAIMRAEPWT